MQKILFVISNCRIGGAENFTLRLVKGLKQHFPETWFECIITHESGDLFQQYGEIFDRLHCFTAINENLKRQAIIEYAHGAALIHSIDNLALMAEVGAMLPGTPLIQNIFMDLSRPVLRNCPRWQQDIRKASRVWAAITEIESNLWHLRYAKKAHVIGNGIDADFWTPGDEPKKKQVCWVGRLTMEKGAYTLYRIIQALPEVTFQVIANEPKTDQGFMHEDFLKLSKWASNLDYRWSLSQNALREVYRASEVYLHTSYTEVQPATLLEAVSCGCIPIAGSVGGIPGILRDQGVLISEPKNINLYTQALKQELESYVYKTASNLLQRVIDNFSIENTARKYAEVYQEVMA